MSPLPFFTRLLFCLGMLLPFVLPAQEIKLAGAVRDRNTHREIRGVNVYFKGTKVGSTTDFAGRFALPLANTTMQSVIVFQHVGYEPMEVTLEELMKLRSVYLQPRVIVLPGVEIEEEGRQRLDIDTDLPQPVSVIDAKSFEIRGFEDAGDLLKTDQSVQVEEQLSGKKTISIRGSNPDEVTVLFNGVKMNSAYDNIFDLQLLDLEDIERLEIIKGSNTALYGPDAFGGVINAVPKVQKDYSVRFQQRLGTYRSGNWGLHFYRNLDKLHASYNFKRGASKRDFVDAVDDNSGLENAELHHTGNLTYRFSEAEGNRLKKELSATYLYTALDYDNFRDFERQNDLNHMVTIRYAAEQSQRKDFNLSLTLRRLDEARTLTSGGAIDSDIDDRAVQVNAEKQFRLGRVDLLTAYQFQASELDYQDARDVPGEQRLGIESAQFDRRQHGAVAIVKLHNDGGSDFFQTVDVDFSLRHDRVLDDQVDYVLRGTPGDPNPLVVAGAFDRNDWRETTFKFAFSFDGYRNNLALNGYLNAGSNVKFPTLLQQTSSPAFFAPEESQPDLNPEKNRSVELGFTISRDVRANTSIYGWQISGNYFQNHYENKFRIAATPGVPVLFFDNVQNARISGIEAKASTFFFRKKATLTGGISRYSISEKSAFPFKSDLKRTLTLNLDHAGYSFQAYWFTESEQFGWLRRLKSGDQAGGQPVFGELAEIALPGFSNLDLHLSKTFQMGKLKLFANATGRNLLNKSDEVLEGLAIRDRRYYLVFGAQF